MKSAIEKLTSVANEYKDSTYKFIAEIIIKKLINKELNITQKELSELCFVSQSTITKFSKFLGFSGFREFWFLLKKELEDYDSVNKVIFETERTFFNPIFQWLDVNQPFLTLLVKNILSSEEYLIYYSYQLQSSAEFMSNSLNSIGIKTSLINHAYFNGINFMENSNKTVLAMISGPDNESIIADLHNLKNNFKKENFSNVFILVSEKQQEKIPVEFQNIANIDIIKNWPSFVQRNIAVSIFVGQLYSNIVKTTFNKRK
ncbi:MurR/RpiR family transcriptional regulator [Mesoplasma chauliocola]|uniref:MurR/RpiR family transcriptional regulator n=1 Tax=Mesoplasma chauliocola TaxID=216427 RepID=A0A249SM69_9MOLU|nr:MurR/RpiR family transcriptional regulator [Mesoplasma chauliocola]ASZ08765.1 MurR/RpiR family transcriptional regulator [Mesoplasma chauliocola]